MNLDEARKNSYEAKIKSVKKTSLVLIISVSVLTGALGFGIGSAVSNKSKTSLSNEMQQFLNYYNTFKENYYQDVSEKTLIDGMYYGLASSVNDDFTFYVSADNNESQNLGTTKTGIGFSRKIYYGNAYVTSVMKNSPAALAQFIDESGNPTGEYGLQDGDIITKIKNTGDSDYYILKDNKSSDWSTHFQGTSGSEVELVILRDGVEKRCTATRGTFNEDKVKLVKNNLSGDYKQAVVSIDSFLGYRPNGETSPAQELIDIFNQEIFTVTDSLDNLVIDLRGNGGGYVINCSELLSLFIGKDQVYGYYYHPKTKTYSPVESGTELKTYSIYNYDGWQNYNSKIKSYTIIIDESTASASESFVMGMKDSDATGSKVKVVGEISYGKGISQSFLYPYSLEYDYVSSIRYTDAIVCSPKKRTINRRGIVPDVMVDAKYRSIQDEDLYDYWRKEITSIDNAKDKAIVLSRIEALLDKDFDGDVSKAIEEFKLENGLENEDIYDTECASKLNDLFIEYYRDNKPVNYYDLFVEGNDDIDSFTSKQRNIVKTQINMLENTAYTTFFEAFTSFQNAYVAELGEQEKEFNLATSYYLQGKIADAKEELEDHVLEVAMNGTEKL